MNIQFCGATTGVTGSCHLIESGEHRILLDCGQFQGGKLQEALNYEPFPFDARKIECVVLSHAHIDHCGRLPLLVKRGFTGRIFCTKATADLLQIMLMDSAYIHEKDAEYQNRKNQRAGRPAVDPLYTQEDAAAALKLVSPVLYNQLIAINPEMKIVFNDAGHILGSAEIELWVTEQDKESKIVFSGDLGMPNRPILRDPTYIKKADYVIMETTYGDRLHPVTGSGAEKLLDIIIKTAARGGSVIIPSFAVGRTQELIYELNRVYVEHGKYWDKLENIDVYVDSPMATSATEVFQQNAEVFDDETREYILKGDNPLEFKNLKFTHSTEESKALNFNDAPKVIISASGMCEAGRIRHHLKHNLWNPKNSIVFVGYQAQGTLGRAILEGVKKVTLFGEEIQINAEIYDLEGFSGHADQNALFTWISSFHKPPKQLFLVHGETASKEAFAKRIHEKLGYKPVVIKGNSCYELDMNEGTILNETDAEKRPADARDVAKVKAQLAGIHGDLEQIIYHANLAMDRGMPQEKMIGINNILQELEKATINLGVEVNAAEEE